MTETRDIAAKPPSPWKPEQDRVRLAILGKLSEELGEASARVARAIIQGIDECDPVTGKSNLRALEEELADVEACVKHLFDLFPLKHGGPYLERARRKYLYLGQWLKMLRGDEA